MGVFEAAQVTAAPVYDAAQLLEDEHLRARGTFVTHDDPDLGPVIAIANEVFSPTPEEVEEARAAMEVYRRAEAEGVGAIGRDGRLVDAAHMRLAANILHRASLAADERGGR
jgi:crotonobetainyl-CoA:carnitine CoA-transferase CaiB-like acyl-CoA transferase